MVNEAIEALKVGDKEKAFGLLRRHLATNPKDATAWLWMSEAATEPTQQIDALQQVLRLAPNHSRAPMIQKRLQALLQATTPQPTLSASPAASTTAPEIEARAADGLRSRLRRDNAPPPETPVHAAEPEMDIEELLRRDSAPTPPPAATTRSAEQLAIEELLRRDSAPTPAPEVPARPAPAEAEIEEWLRTEEDEPVRTVSASSVADLRAELFATPAAEPEVMPPPAPVISEPEPLERLEERPMAESVRAEGTPAAASPLPRPTPPQEDKIPAWVWGIMLGSIIIFGVIFFFMWQYLQGS